MKHRLNRSYTVLQITADTNRPAWVVAARMWLGAEVDSEIGA